MLVTVGDAQENPSVVLARRIADGDGRAEQELFKLYYRGVRHTLSRRSQDFALAEDLAQETLLTVLTRLREGTVSEPEHLHRFIQQTAKFLYIGWTRRRVNQTEYRGNVDDAPDENSAETIFEREESRRIIRELIGEINVPRDRELLHRYYVRDEDKNTICEALGLSADHFDKVISRARSRFRKIAKARLST